MNQDRENPPLPADEVAQNLSAHEEKTLRLFKRIAGRPDSDPRWADIANTHIEQGYMAIKRSLFSGNRVTDGGGGEEESSDDVDVDE